MNSLHCRLVMSSECAAGPAISVCVFISPRLEVQADVQKERYSLSGESGTVSLGTVSDNASTKAMAGSILNSYIPLDR